MSSTSAPDLNDFIASDGHSYMAWARVFSVLSFTAIVSMILYHIVSMIKRVGTHEFNRITSLMTYTIVGVSFIITMIITLYAFQVLPGKIGIPCLLWVQIIGFLIALNQFTLLLSYFYRVQIIFIDTTFAVSKCCLRSSCISSVVWFIIYLVYVFVETEHRMSRDGEWLFHEEYGYCYRKGEEHPTELMIVSLVGLYQMIISIVLLIIFLKPLCQLSKIEDLKPLIFKICLLNGVMILTTFITYTTYFATGGGIFIGIDAAINAICVLLMRTVNERLYTFLCCIGCCFKSNDDVNKLSQVHVDSRSTNKEQNSTNTTVTTPTATQSI
eukprot:129948_1